MPSSFRIDTEGRRERRERYCAATANSRRPPVTTLVERLDLPASFL